MSRHVLRDEVSARRLYRSALLLMPLSLVFGLLLAANIVVLLLITGDRTMLVVQVGILAVLTVLFVTGAWALQRMISSRRARRPN